MPKKSNEQTNIVPLPHANNRLRPPPTLSQAERNLFVELVAANPPEHFRASDMPLLVSYCASVVLGERAVAELRQAPINAAGKASPWLVIFEKANRAVVALSLRLRLSPQARAPNPTRRAAQLNDKLLHEPWAEVAKSASYVCQCEALHCRLWERPPCFADNPLRPGQPHDRVGTRLLTRMAAAGISRFVPDPLAALEAAKEKV